MTDQVVEVVRGRVVESTHRVHAAVVDADGRTRAFAGDPDRVTFFRSGAKPFQAIPIVMDGAMDRFGLTLEELAICCGSHSGQSYHVDAVLSVLSRVGVRESALACGTQEPLHRETRTEMRARGIAAGALHHNCSGKHAGMMSVARARGWDPAGYERAEHPVQGRLLSEMARWAELPLEAIALGTDGCGVVTFGMPLRDMAAAYARLSRAARLGEREATYIVGAMTAYPKMVGGDGRLCTDLMQRTGGRVLGKGGAEGLFCVGVPGAELGVVIKVEDGGARAMGPAILTVLRQLDIISEEDLGALHKHAYPELRSSRGDAVGEIRADFALDCAAG